MWRWRWWQRRSDNYWRWWRRRRFRRRDYSCYAMADDAIILLRVLEAMNPAHAEAVVLHVLHGAPAKEVADRLGLSESNVNQIARRFRVRMADALDDDGGRP